MASPSDPKKNFDVGRTLPPRSIQGRRTPDTPRPPSALAEPTPEPKSRRAKLKRVLVSGLLILIAATLLISGWDAVNISRAAKKTFGSGNLFSLLNPTSLKGADSGRVNVLLVGYSVDDPGHPGATLTDSIILLSLSSSAHTGYMLSIPRDLYVQIPGFGYGKLNEAYQDGGMDLLEQIVVKDFQMPIDYYAIFNYAAVRDTVNALGGITVNIQSPDPRGLYDPNISTADGGPLKLSNGVQKLNGQTALNLTRARGDAYNSYGFPQADFDRTTHQRQVLTAIKDKLNWKLVLNPLQNGKIFSAVGQNVRTDIKLGEVRPLFGLFNSVPSANLKSLSLRNLNGTNYLSSYYTDSGENALVPTAGLSDYSQIDGVLSQQ